MENQDPRTEIRKALITLSETHAPKGQRTQYARSVLNLKGYAFVRDIPEAEIEDFIKYLKTL